MVGGRGKTRIGTNTGYVLTDLRIVQLALNLVASANHLTADHQKGCTSVTQGPVWRWAARTYRRTYAHSHSHS